ncbi:PH domain-containing protein [Catellatospora tritici]|uniref:PH domain-containing protein n=1 Tax=Catellatospora tritici TaxID=2851566 RepID=UPI001C2D591C|nr:PH domain-containing protein [Catellatospora tritici]MBV1849100.1 PH domain-containing protein [Catellatospora tritici]
MAFPEDVLTDGEQVELDLHPHWKAMIWPVTVLVLALAAVISALVLLDNEVLIYIIAGVAVVAVAWLSFWPWLVWRTTHYVLTNERVLLQTGVFSRDRRDIPLSRVNDHSMNQRFVERLLGCGTLTIESAGERGQSVLRDIPHVEKVQTRLYELVEADRDAYAFNDSERGAKNSAPAQATRAEAEAEEK